MIALDATGSLGVSKHRLEPVAQSRRATGNARLRVYARVIGRQALDRHRCHMSHMSYIPMSHVPTYLGGHVVSSKPCSWLYLLSVLVQELGPGRGDAKLLRLLLRQQADINQKTSRGRASARNDSMTESAAEGCAFRLAMPDIRKVKNLQER